ncbi:MAG TPA: metallophosphoesterase [Gaiellaceae bacterium]|nr:metallophosphoesterase [Gaiellaceae bacterium]HET8652614.1 metallophosphoesterase [Gaiellaceae bacterium]
MDFAAVLLGVMAALLPVTGHAQGQMARPDTVLAIGDFGVGGATQGSLGTAVRRFEARNPADLLVTLGDNDYTESPIAFRSNWQSSFGWARRGGLRVAGVLGNHDVRVDGGRYEYRALGMPGRYYRLRRRTLELFLLDSNKIDTAQTSWLARSLARSTARWKIAVLHHPAYTCGSYRSNPEVVRRWVPLFERHGVRLVLSGHEHSYQRFAPKRGVRYVVHGGGSGRFYDPQRCPAGYPRRLRARREQGFLYLVARPDRLDGWSVVVDGRRSDHFTFRADG